MDNNKKPFNFTFPDSSTVTIVLDDRPINKTSFLPQQQPLIFGGEGFPYTEYNFIYQPVTKAACKTIKAWMLSFTIPDFTTKVGESNFGKDIEWSHMNDRDFNIHDSSLEVFGAVHTEQEKFIDGMRKLSYNNSIVKFLNPYNFEFADEIEDYFKFTFVRNPWSRIISAYMEKFRDYHESVYKPATEITNSFKRIISESHPKYFKEYFDEDGVLSFKGFVDIFYQYSKESYDNFDIHWLPQHLINDMYIKDFDFIGKLENFESDFDKILETLNIKIKPKYKIGSNSHMFQSHYKFYENNPELIDKVAEIYKEDIKRYNYDFSDLEK